MDISAGRKLVIATMHGKENVIAPLLEKSLKVKTFIPSKFDTNKFGTFTGEIKRLGNQLEAAIKKLEAAMKKEDCDLGVASEGSFGGSPNLPIMNNNLELVVLIDKKYDLKIIGQHSTYKTNNAGKSVKTVEEGINFAKRIGFPSHGLIIKKSQKKMLGMTKNILSEIELRSTLSRMLRMPFRKEIWLETDMRAHQNPTRMKAIEKATVQLLENILSLCPKCESPGFAIKESIRGLPCEHCRLPTSLAKSHLFYCQKCNFTEKKSCKENGDYAPQKYCDLCNP